MHEFPAPDMWFSHRVSYGETDCMGVMYYAEYLHLFERARSEFIRACGVSYADVEKRGVLLPVREVQCRYRHPARYDELVWIRIAIQEWRKASLKFVYELYSEDKGTLLAEGMTLHALVNQAGRPLPVPKWFRDLIEQPAPGGSQADSKPAACAKVAQTS